MHIEAALHDHYAVGSTELVLGKLLHPNCAGEVRPRPRILGKPPVAHKLFDLAIKRGGATKIQINLELCWNPLFSSIEDLLEEVLSIKEIKNARRVYLHSPRTSAVSATLKTFGFIEETLQPISTKTESPEVVYARNFSR